LVCDSDNDKGIDGIFVDEISEELCIFQSKYSHNPASSQGDKDKRDFVGASSWFSSADNLQLLDQSNASQELKSLATRLEVFERIRMGYTTRLVFVTNRRFDNHANEFLQVLGDRIEAWDIDDLWEQYTYTGKDKPVEDTFTFSIEPNNLITYQTRNDVKVIIFPAKATELVQLEGIQDRTLFARNVRYGLGRTRVNKDIAKTLKGLEHDNFFLYHNGITLVCSDFDREGSELKITNYSIVNGCQSTLSFYENKKYLSNEIKVLLRVIKIGTDDQLSQDVTYYTNNQNAISLKDLKSNDKVQQDLQEEFFRLLSKTTLYKIKSGEDEAPYQRVIENDFAGQLITSFFLREPHTAHQKSQLFADNYSKIFNRHINAAYIFLIAEIYRAIDENSRLIDDEGIRTYKLTRFFFVYVFRLIFEEDGFGQKLLMDPSVFLASYQSGYFEGFVKLFKFLVLDFNNYVNEQKQTGYFDYKNTLRNATKVDEMARDMVTAYRRNLIRHPEDAFAQLIG
jgi:hypothetical protein